jgi:drug/metabolite transporter (DMT)-like permease
MFTATVTRVAGPTGSLRGAPLLDPVRLAGLLPWLCLGLLYLIWGSTYLGLRVAVREGMPPLTLVGWRFVLAGGLLYVGLRLRGQPALRPREWLGSGVVGLLLVSVSVGAVAWAVQRVPSGLAALVFATMPLWGALLEWRLGQKLRAVEAAGVALGVGAVVLVATRGGLGVRPLELGLVLLASLSTAAGVSLSRRLPPVAGAMGGPVAGAAQMLVGGLVISIVALAAGETPPRHLSAAALEAFAYLTVVGSMVGFTAFTCVVRRLRPAVAQSYAYVNPLVALGLGAALAGETLSGRELVAAAMVVAAVVLAATRDDRARPPRAPAGAAASPAGAAAGPRR